MNTPCSSSSSRLSRRAFVGRAALAGAAGLAAGPLGRRSRASAQSGLTGEIVVSFTDPTGTRQPYAARAAEAIQAANPGATVTVDAQEIPSSEYQTRLFLGMRTGNVPDVFHLPGAAIGALGAQGVIRALDEYLADWPDWQAYPQPVRDSVSFDGQVWAIPYALDTHFLYFRRNVFEQRGLPRDWQPANVDAILDDALVVKQGGSDVIPYAIYAGDTGGNATVVRGFLPLLFAYGGTLTDEQGKWIIDSPAIRKTFRFYARAFRHDELVPEELLSTPSQTAALPELFGNGRLAMFYDGAWVYGPWRNADPEGAAEQVGYLLHPTETGGPSFTVGGTGNVWFISAASKAPDLAWEFVKTINAAETVAEICLADPHPAARTDAAEAPAYQADPFLVEATASLQVAIFAPPSPAYLDLIPLIRTATGLVATGEADPDDAAARYAEDLERILGADNVVTQS